MYIYSLGRKASNATQIGRQCKIRTAEAVVITAPKGKEPLFFIHWNVTTHNLSLALFSSPGVRWPRVCFTDLHQFYLMDF
jgi:hypothetical protein